MSPTALPLPDLVSSTPEDDVVTVASTWRHAQRDGAGAAVEQALLRRLAEAVDALDANMEADSAQRGTRPASRLARRAARRDSVNGVAHPKVDEAIVRLVDEGRFTAGELALRVAKVVECSRDLAAARTRALRTAGTLRTAEGTDWLEIAPGLECTVCRCTEKRRCAKGCLWVHPEGARPFCSACDALEREIAAFLRTCGTRVAKPALVDRFRPHAQIGGHYARLTRALDHALDRGLLARPRGVVAYIAGPSPAAASTGAGA